MHRDAASTDAELERRKKKTDIVATWFGMAAVALGGAYGAWEYLQKKNDDRVKETIAFFDRYQKEPAAGSRIKVQTAWRKHDDERRCLLAQAKDDFTDYRAFVLKTIAQEKIDQDVENLVEFFGALQICIAKRLCDKTTAQAYFGNAARSFYRTHAVWIETTRKRWNDPAYAEELKSFQASLPRKAVPSTESIDAIKKECEQPRGTGATPPVVRALRDLRPDGSR